MIILAFALTYQGPLIDFESDRKAFEPVRQCVLADAKSQYSTGSSLKEIFDRAKMTCAREDLKASATITLSAIERAEKASDGKKRPDYDQRLSRLYEELLFEVANDFVPKSR